MSRVDGARRIDIPASHPYDVVIGAGLLDRLGCLVRDAVADSDRRCLVVTDDNVGALYLGPAREALRGAGFAVEAFTFPHGEGSKTLQTYARILDAAYGAELTRSSTVVALGGGVVGDLAGFAASTYMRGCNLVQVPTSLLAMVDSSVGGKTGVDLPGGKNLVGTFYQPRLVVCDTGCLETLPGEYVADGLGEVVKYAVLRAPELLEAVGRLGGSRGSSGSEGPWSWDDVVERCVGIKRRYVVEDEREAGVRKHLNLGHTFGHAIERLSGFGIPHGHAVAMGLDLMVWACRSRGWVNDADARTILGALDGLGFDLRCPYGAEDLADACAHDKKRSGDRLDVVVVRGLAATEVVRVSLEELGAIARDGLEAQRAGRQSDVRGGSL